MAAKYEQIATLFDEHSKEAVKEKVDVLRETFITQDEIDAAIRGGSSVSH